MNKYYFSFGSSKQFPYQGGYLVVHARDKIGAIAKYREHYPDVNDNLINCAFIYSEEEWTNISEKGKCHEIIH